ncbi:hypothetical protein ACIBBG_32060 [Micromonospora chersina]|uniref:hypothetical protein n=1 Tax=Micromonospora chersina TaxID=47854 RepID=UPI0037BA4FB7
MSPLWVSALVWLVSLEPGDAATWIGALANIATVILAAVASAVGFRVYKIESGRDARAEQDRRERAEDERRSQATRVSAWYGFGDSGLGGPAFGGRVLNASELPIYDVIVSFFKGDFAIPSAPWRMVTLRVVPPTHREVFVDPQQEDRTRFANSVLKHLDVEVAFRDAAGRYWRRDRHGFLEERPGPT